MKNFFGKVWGALKRGFQMFFISSWYAWFGAILGVIAGLIWNQGVGITVFFSVVGAFIGYIWIRQIYWWFTGKVDYINRGFPKLWKKITRK